jgi:predicted SprT family Zn-dependent metalloprotease
VRLRRRGSYGHFRNDGYRHRTQGKTMHELNLNPDGFIGRDERSILSTLLHEMVHCNQQEFGQPSRGGYHNREWAGMMKAVGLYPSDTGAEGGKETGPRMTHYILPNDRFARAYKKLEATGFRLDWESVLLITDKKPVSKVKYSCGCGTNAWAKPETNLICGSCGEHMQADDESDA